jgi:hypothetical protein
LAGLGVGGNAFGTGVDVVGQIIGILVGFAVGNFIGIATL